MHWRLSVCLPLLGLSALLLAAFSAARVRDAQRLSARLDALAQAAPAGACLGASSAVAPPRGSPLLASWQSVAGCGASAATGAGAGVKWVGRSVTGGLFNVQCQGTYSPLLADPSKVEHHFVVNTLVSREITDRWSVGVSIPFVYKYLRDPYQLDIDLSNGGLGDASVQTTYELGAIGATSVTPALGLPTGTWNVAYRNSPLRQHQQLGFGKYTGSLTVDHTMDQTWGVVVVGGVGSWRGGENRLGNYRAPSGTAYSYAGFYLGPFVPTLGVATTYFRGHDRDRTEEENSAILLVAANASLEWSTDWIAVLIGASLPYQYDAVYRTSEGTPRSPYRWGQWVLGMGVTVAPF
jgi:hypothetical protein